MIREVRGTAPIMNTCISKMPPFLSTIVSGEHGWVADGDLEGLVFLEGVTDKTTYQCPSSLVHDGGLQAVGLTEESCLHYDDVYAFEK